MKNTKTKALIQDIKSGNQVSGTGKFVPIKGQTMKKGDTCKTCGKVM